jgi:uncharacterized NAD(P)/FAD-binding protein YdhS
LQHLLQKLDQFLPTLTHVFLFDKPAALGIGLPCDGCTTHDYNLFNIHSAAVPPMHETFVRWLHSLSNDQLTMQWIIQSGFEEDETYRRTTLGDYFHQQHMDIAADLRARGLILHEFCRCTAA